MLVNGNNTQGNTTGTEGQGQQQVVAQQTPSANLMNADPNDLTFLFNQETGELEMNRKQLETPKQLEQPLQTQTQQQAETHTANPFEDRFLRLEQGLVTIASFLEGMKNGQVNNLNPQQTQQTQQPIDYSEVNIQDGNAIAAIVRQELKLALKNEIAPLINQTSQLRVESSYNRAMSEFGKEFKEALPTIQGLVESGILKSDENTDFAKIFLQLKKVGLFKSDSANSHSTIQPVNGSTPNGNGKPQTAEALVQRANALSTESPGAQRTIINNGKVKHTSIDSAVEAAIQEVYGG